MKPLQRVLGGVYEYMNVGVRFQNKIPKLKIAKLLRLKEMIRGLHVRRGTFVIRRSVVSVLYAGQIEIKHILLVTAITNVRMITSLRFWHFRVN